MPNRTRLPEVGVVCLGVVSTPASCPRRRFRSQLRRNRPSRSAPAPSRAAESRRRGAIDSFDQRRCIARRIAGDEVANALEILPCGDQMSLVTRFSHDTEKPRSSTGTYSVRSSSKRPWPGHRAGAVAQARGEVEEAGARQVAVVVPEGVEEQVVVRQAVPVQVHGVAFAQDHPFAVQDQHAVRGRGPVVTPPMTKSPRALPTCRKKQSANSASVHSSVAPVWIGSSPATIPTPSR